MTPGVSSLAPQGFWGPVTSTVDWCEANYEHTRYVCELYNTLSSAAMVLAGALGVYLHRRTLERRFAVAFCAVAVVGIGSMAFHATLKFRLQMLDELPMLYTALVMIYVLLENERRPRFGAWLPAALGAHGVLVTSLSSMTRGALQFYFFQVSFASMEFFALYRVYRIYRRSDLDLVRRLFRAGMAAYGVAVGLWMLDLKACGVLGGLLPAHRVPNPQLHAWWHVLVSCGLYLLTLVIACDRLQVLGSPPELRRFAGVVPYVAVSAPPTARG
ncbi:MAG TPA: ceramidase [Polyangiaceae bacterium]|nr:ceramidase [Polyangiaceae bacterium]